MKGNRLVPDATAIGCAFATAILAAMLFTSIPARADVDVQINIGNAPPAPSIVFRARPHERLFPGERVYVVDDPGVGDNDCFRYGGYYWVFREGYWYRSPSWRGRFAVVHPRYVPTMFYRLPPARWKHHPNGPPGLMKKRGGGPPGLMKEGDGGPPGHTKKGGRGDDKRGDRGGS
jgi:hypothetical protein